MRERISLPKIPKEGAIIEKGGDKITLFWEYSRVQRHVGMIHQERVYGALEDGSYHALIAERRGKRITVFLQRH